MSAGLDLGGAPAASARRFQALALSGGGARGLYTACVLEGLEARAGVPLHRCFDLLAGTSIGGIIALGLAVGRSAREVRELVETASAVVFPRSGPLHRLRGLFRARYDSGPLRDVIEEVVGADTRLGDLRTPLLVPAVALTAGGVRVFRSAHHGAHAAQADMRLVDVALTTAAAPAMFPLVRVGDAEYVDGGLVAHAPDALALHEAQVFFGRRRDDVFMLGVGTTRDLSALAAGGQRSRGLLFWMRENRLAEVVMGAQQGLAQGQVREALGNRYLVINSPRSRDQADTVAMDRSDPQAVATLKSMARHALEEAEADASLARFLSHRAGPDGDDGT